MGPGSMWVLWQCNIAALCLKTGAPQPQHSLSHSSSKQTMLDWSGSSSGTMQ